MALSLPPLLCRHAQSAELVPQSVRWAAELTVQAVNETLHVYMLQAYKHVVYRPAVWRFWYLASLNVSAVPPLHSGFFCVTSPGLNYVFMGQVDEDGKGKIAPHHFVMAFKTKNQKGLNVLKDKRCWGQVCPRLGCGWKQLSRKKNKKKNKSQQQKNKAEFGRLHRTQNHKIIVFIRFAADRTLVE